MYLLMFNKIPILWESLVTNFSYIWLLPSVLSQMITSSFFYWETLIRKTTFTDMICQHCESLYALKMARLGKRLVTLSRVVWFVTFLTYHTTSKLTRFKERLTTFSTSVWFTTSVGPYMIFKFTICIEIHVTHTTLVYFVTSVTHHMCHKSPSLGERFTTMATLVLFFPCVSSHMSV